MEVALVNDRRSPISAASMKILGALGAAGILLVGVTVSRADAKVGGSATPTWPATVAVGATFNASVLILNVSPPPDDTHSIVLTALFVTPACADNVSPICLLPNVDPGTFDVLSAVGDASTAPCNAVTFTVSAPVPPSGEVQLTPNTMITLGPANEPEANRSCRVNLTLRAKRLPSNPAGGVAGRTDPLARVALQDATSGVNGSASASAQITVDRGTPTMTSSSLPVLTPLPIGVSVRDEVFVSGSAGTVTPTGTVTFFLCQPFQVTPGGCVSGGAQIGTAKTLAGTGLEATSSSTSDATTNTQTFGKYCWRVAYSGDSNYLPASHTDNATECFNAFLPVVEMLTQPNPSEGIVLQTALGDVATLQAFNPTGTMTFSLFAPDDQNCVGNPIFVSVVLVNGQGSYGSETFPAASVTQPGIYNWTVGYSGDAFNPPANSPCGEEPVMIRAAATPVPTLSTLGMALFAVLLVTIGSVVLMRRRKPGIERL